MPDFGKDVLPLILSLAMIVLVLYLCYVTSRYLAKKAHRFSNSANIKVLERAALGQDKGLAIVEVAGMYYLIGYANNDMKILKELNDFENYQQQNSDLQKPMNFIEMFTKATKGQRPSKPSKNSDDAKNSQDNQDNHSNQDNHDNHSNQDNKNIQDNKNNGDADD